jgi:hypothetical protein
MNLISLMIAVSMMSIGTLVSAYFLIEPPLALFRLSGQADAETIVETLRLRALRGKRIEPVKSGGTITSVNLVEPEAEPGKQPITITLEIPSTCTMTEPFGSRLGVTIICKGTGYESDSRQARFRSSQTVLIGGYPCESDLFASPCPPSP